MQYKITLKNKNISPIFLDHTKGMKIKEKWIDKNVKNDFKIALDDIVFEKGKIDTIEIVKQNVVPKMDENKAYQEYYKEYQKIKKLSPDKKADHPEQLNKYRHVYKAIHGEYPSEKILNMLKTKLITFFAQNPDRTMANYNVYKPFLYNKKKGHKITVIVARMLEMYMLNIAQDAQFCTKFAQNLHKTAHVQTCANAQK